jgi:hypothetical protein
VTEVTVFIGCEAQSLRVRRRLNVRRTTKKSTGVAAPSSSPIFTELAKRLFLRAAMRVGAKGQARLVTHVT